MPLDPVGAIAIFLGRGRKYGKFYPKQVPHKQAEGENSVRGMARKITER